MQSKECAITECKRLMELLEYELIPDLEDMIDDIFEEIDSLKKVDDDLRLEYIELQELKASFEELLKDIEVDEVSEEECKKIYDELAEMLG